MAFVVLSDNLFRIELINHQELSSSVFTLLNIGMSVNIM